MKYVLNSKKFAIPYLLVIAACSGSRDEKSAPLEPKVLDLKEFHSQTFADLSWEAKCSGTRQFFSDFQKNYLPDVNLSFSEETCRREYDFGDSYLNIIDPILEKDGNVLKLAVNLSSRFYPDTFSLRADYTEIDRRVEEISRDGKFE